jgi:hypothetical protein
MNIGSLAISLLLSPIRLEEGSITYSRSADSTYTRESVPVGDVCKWQIVQVSGRRKGKEGKSGKLGREEGKKEGIKEDGKGGEEKEKEERRNRGKESELGKRREWREEKRKDERGETDRMNEMVRVRVRVTES